ncbi:hypothetical protein BGX26_001519 [Mortierella sp. AD094]|nr:hypothetical protein BGX26_001519 [Mortierella sp. AD094]
MPTNCYMGLKLTPDIDSPLRQLKRERLKDRGGDVYISPRARTNARATEDFDLASKVQQFLESDRKVFLILGDAGAGKSTFNRALEISLWDKYGNGDRRIPLFIELPVIERPELDLVAERLRRANFTENQIRELKAHHEFIVICDGYDECNQTRNLYVSNDFNHPGGWRAQMVISCRTEYTGVDYRDWFQPIDRNNRGKAEQFQEAIIAPFNENQIRDYVDQYVLLGKPQWKLDDHQRAFRQIPNLQDQVKNPFLLKLALVVLPRLVQTNSKFSTVCITRIGLYDEFIAQWIERGKIRLREMELSPRNQETFREFLDSGFRQYVINYLKDLVTAIYNHQNGNPVVSYSEHRDRETWKEALFSMDDGKYLLREAIPLTHDGNQYRFIHKSILEYGLTLVVFDPSEYSGNMEPTSTISRRVSANSVLSFEATESTETAGIILEQNLIESPLGKKDFVGQASILELLSERAQQQPMFIDQLYPVIEKSKTDRAARTAAANAIKILAQAGVQFNGADLRGIQIPGADLSFGVFDSAHLEEADLRKVKYRNIWLRQANLSGAQMTGVEFGEPPFLQEDSEVSRCAYSPDGKTFISGLKSGGIRLYDTSSWSRIRSLDGHKKKITCVTYSPKGDQIASGSEDNTVRR